MEETPSHAVRNCLAWKYLIPGLLVLAGLTLVLYAFPPDQYRFYPRCVLKRLTGWDCPGCGGLRAGHHLLHGRVAEAVRLNPFLVVAASWALALGAIDLYRWMVRSNMANPMRRAGVLWTMTILMVLFGILRNVDWQ